MTRNSPNKKTVEIQRELFSNSGRSAKYRALILGRPGFFRLIAYELIMMLTQNLPGALGLLLRSRLFPWLLGHTGRNVTFGRGVTLRHPHKIFIGNDVVIDDGCVLDAKGENNRGISIGNGVFIGRHSILNCKNGDIIIQDRANISSHVTIFSASEVRIGADELLAAYAYLVGGTHTFADPAVPVLKQGRSSLGIEIGGGGWVGAHVTVFDGVKIGKHAIIGAGSAVHRKIPDYAIAAGNPVTIINKRKGEGAVKQRPELHVVYFASGDRSADAAAIQSVREQDYPSMNRILVAADGDIDPVLLNNSGSKGTREVSFIKMACGSESAWKEIIQQCSSDLVVIHYGAGFQGPDYLSILADYVASRPEAALFCPKPARMSEKMAGHFKGMRKFIANPFMICELKTGETDLPETVILDKRRLKEQAYF